MDTSSDNGGSEFDGNRAGHSSPSGAGESGDEVQPAKGKGPGRGGASLVLVAESIAASGEPSETKRPGLFRRFLRYGSQAALMVCLVGFGWALTSHFLKERAATGEAARNGAAQENLERAEMHRVTEKMAEDIRALKTNLDALRSQIAQIQNPDEARAIKRGVDNFKTGLESVKTEMNASIAQLSSKIDHMQREPAAKLQQVVERLDRLEKQATMPAASGTSTVGKTAKAESGSASKQPVPKAEGEAKPKLITSWVVRDVYDGVALVENQYGSLEVSPGETIPGAGRVKSIERRGSGWVVITSHGLVDYARE